MPNITNYDCMGGKILATKTGSLASVNLLDDALESVTATSLSTSATSADTYGYLPYGGTLTRSGTKADPKVGWVGSWGYRNNYRNSASHYVRARNYDKSSTRWTTADPLWPKSSAYSYSVVNPMTIRDPSGQFPWPFSGLATACALVVSIGYKDTGLAAVNDCIKKSLAGSNTICPPLTRAQLQCVGKACDPANFTVNDPRYCCYGGLSSSKGFPCAVPDDTGPTCKVVICTNRPNFDSECGDVFSNIDPFLFNLLHEGAHCCGIEHGTSEDESISECNDIVACCMAKVAFGNSFTCNGKK